MHPKPSNEPTLLRRPQVQQRTGLSRTTLYEYIKDGEFPAPVRLGARAVGWVRSGGDCRDAVRPAAHGPGN